MKKATDTQKKWGHHFFQLVSSVFCFGSLVILSTPHIQNANMQKISYLLNLLLSKIVLHPTFEEDLSKLRTSSTCHHGPYLGIHCHRSLSSTCAGNDGKRKQWRRKWQHQWKQWRRSSGNRGSGSGGNGGNSGSNDKGSKTETSAAKC